MCCRHACSVIFRQDIGLWCDNCRLEWEEHEAAKREAERPRIMPISLGDGIVSIRFEDGRQCFAEIASADLTKALVQHYHV